MKTPLCKLHIIQIEKEKSVDEKIECAVLEICKLKFQVGSLQRRIAKAVFAERSAKEEIEIIKNVLYDLNAFTC